MLQHTPHPAPWVKMRLVSKAQVGDSGEVVDLDDSVSMCEAIGADPLMNGIGIPAESVLPSSWIICSSSSVVLLPYSQKQCMSLSASGSVSCPLMHSPTAQQQWSNLLEQLQSNVNKAVDSVVHSGSKLPEELRFHSPLAIYIVAPQVLTFGSSFGDNMSCPEWCTNFARSIIDSLDSSGQVMLLLSNYFRFIVVI
jgi:hypothetical protein